ncbi:RNA polymerase-associated protein LEO1 [Leucoagaricus sp. SymC.cos]|nr:RNA polymerase-associated protein LEO1 [Leucoagaricus sp. SymC.cos]
MSSLSGALDESALKPLKPDPTLNDVEMQPESHHSASDSEGGGREEQDEEMADLFGNEDEEEPKPGRSVAASPTASGPESDRLPTPERERRQALEYEEDEIPPDTGEVVKEELSGPTAHVHCRRQSNSRIIRWSDGTLSLLLGKELFDITQTVDTSAGVPRQIAGSSASQSQTQLSQSQSQTSGLKSQGLTYLVAQHKRSQVLQSEAVVTGYMSLRPTGMQSETHRMLVRAVGQKHNKVARLRLVSDPTMDPERDLKELAKQNAKKSRRKNDFDELSGGRRKRTSRRSTDTGALWSSDEEAAGEYDNYDDDDEDGGSGGEKKTGEDYQEDDFLVADSSDEEGVLKKKRVKDTSDAEEDPLDRLDAKIEEQDAKKRKKPGKSGNASDETDEDVMDVESEEEDGDDFKVRRVGGGRKRTHISMEEDED